MVGRQIVVGMLVFVPAMSPSMLSVVVGVSSMVPGSDVAVLSLVFVYGMLPPSMVPKLFSLLSVLLGALSSEAVRAPSARVWCRSY